MMMDMFKLFFINIENKPSTFIRKGQPLDFSGDAGRFFFLRLPFFRPALCVLGVAIMIG